MNQCERCDKRDQCHEEGRLFEYFNSEDMATMTTHLALKPGQHCPYKNCQTYCQYARWCKQLQCIGTVGRDPYECGNYYRIDDILADARDIAEEQRKSEEEFDDECE